MPPLFLCGPAGSGKDTTARAITREFGHTARWLGEPIKATLATPEWQTTLTLAAAHTEYPPAVLRRFAGQGLGDAFRAVHCDLLVWRLANTVEESCPAIVVSDVRLPQELTALRDIWPTGLAIYCDTDRAEQDRRLITRDGAPMDPLARGHWTEIAVRDLRDDADFRWDNNGSWETTWPVLREWLITRGVTPLVSASLSTGNL